MKPVIKTVAAMFLAGLGMFGGTALAYGDNSTAPVFDRTVSVKHYVNNFPGTVVVHLRDVNIRDGGERCGTNCRSIISATADPQEMARAAAPDTTQVVLIFDEDKASGYVGNPDYTAAIVNGMPPFTLYADSTRLESFLLPPETADLIVNGYGAIIVPRKSISPPTPVHPSPATPEPPVHATVRPM